MRVALVVMPLAAADRPSLAAGLLKAGLDRRGIECDVKHFNLTLWKMVGAEAYRYLSHEVPTPALAGEWAFAQSYWEEPPATYEAYREEVLSHPVWGLSAEGEAHVTALREVVPAFLRVALSACDWGAYDLVGFTSTFEQTMASLSLARLIRRRHPRPRIALGGANFESGMGRPYLEAFDFVDFVSTGEADLSFPALCEALRDGDDGVPPGFLARDGDQIVDGGRPAPSRLDDLPVPEFEDYFRVLGRTASPAQPPPSPWLPVEGSRGCWWGERSHCTFCGLNGETMPFRAKSASRVAAEVDELHARHGALPLQFADNILSMGFFKDLLPEWAARAKPPTSFFEVKANLRRSQLRLLRSAGVTAVQPGVESLSDTTLRLMQKGVAAARNVACLRWGAEAGLEVFWNLIYGFPGEEMADYPVMLSLLTQMVHLPIPSAAAPIRLDRFSPNFERWREHGFTSVAPVPAYRHVFPFGDEALFSLASYFRFDHPGLAEALERGADLSAFLRTWRERADRNEAGELAVRDAPGGELLLVDTRFTRGGGTSRLSEAEAALLLAADAPASRELVLARAGRALGGADGPALDSALASLLDRAVVARVGDPLVTLALLPDDFRVGPLARAE